MASDPSTQATVRVVRVFTREGAGGNLLGIHDGLLKDAAMQAIAADLGFSETIFLGEPVESGTVPVRIFTPATELPFAGHPLVGAAWHVAAPGESVTFRCGIGDVAGHRADPVTASVVVDFVPSVAPATAPADVVDSWIATMPLPYEIHRLPSADAVAGYEPADRPAHRLVWAHDEHLIRARFFAPASGVDEDPATGSAAVGLAAVLRHLGNETGSITIHQGDELGCPSRLDVEWTSTSTTVGGAVTDDGRRIIAIRGT